MPLISIRLTLALLIATVAVVTFLVSFLPTYLNGIKAIDTAVLDMRNSTKNHVAESVSTYFSRTWESVAQLQKLAENGVANISDYNSLEQFMVEKVDESRAYLGSVTYVNTGKYVWKAFDTSLGPNEAEIFHIEYHFNSWADFGMTQGFVKADNHSVYMTEVPWFDDNGDGVLRTRGVPPFALATISPFPTQVISPGAINVAWVAPELNYDRFQLTCVGLVPDGTTLGRYAEALTTGRLNTILNDLTLRRRARAILFDAKHSLDGRLLAARDPIVPYRVLDTSNQLPLWESVESRFIHNISDPLLDDIVRKVGKQSIVNGTELSYTVETETAGGTYFELIEISQPNLIVRVALAMPLIDFLEEVNEARTIALVSSIICLAVVIVVAILLGHAITVPMVDLGARMALTATFRDERTEGGGNQQDDNQAVLTEVARLQTAYYKMRDNLMKAKSYLPESLIRSAQEEDTDDDYEEEVNTYMFVTKRANDEEEEERSVDERNSHTNSNSQQHRTPSSSVAGGAKGVSGRGRFVNDGASSSLRHTDGTSTHRSRRSRQKSLLLGYGTEGGTGAHTVAALNTAASLSQKKVSIAVFNLVGFRNVVAKSGTNGTLEAQSLILSIVHKHVKENKGLIDYFQGDHIVASFNAATNVAMHPRRAATAVVGATNEINNNNNERSELADRRLSAGMSTGTALVGNMGTSELKRSCIVGQVYHEATLLERRARSYGPDVSNLVLSRHLTDLETAFRCRSLDLAVLHNQNTAITAAAVGSDQQKEHGPTRPAVLLTLLSSKSSSSGPRANHHHHQHQDEEWMYELDQAAKKDPFTLVNHAFFTLAAGELTEAATTIEKAKGQWEQQQQQQQEEPEIGGKSRNHSNDGPLFSIAFANLEEVLALASSSSATSSSGQQTQGGDSQGTIISSDNNVTILRHSLSALLHLRHLNKLVAQQKKQM